MLLALAVAMMLAAQAAPAKSVHVYTVHLTIEADGGKLHGTVVSAAPYEECEGAKVKIKQVLPGADKTVAKVKPAAREWSLATSGDLRGAAVYAETSAYEVPAKAVRCLGARSKTVTAP